MTDAPPALTQRPQFTAEYWQKVPRQTVKAKIDRVTNLEDDWVEIVLTNGAAMRRAKSEINTLLTANLDIEVEMIKMPTGIIVTGLFVPSKLAGPLGGAMGQWAFRMTAEDLAEYAKEVTAVVHEQNMAMRANEIHLMGELIKTYLLEKTVKASINVCYDDQRHILVESTIDVDHMAAALVDTIAEIQSQQRGQ